MDFESAIMIKRPAVPYLNPYQIVVNRRNLPRWPSGWSTFVTVLVFSFLTVALILQTEVLNGDGVWWAWSVKNFFINLYLSVLIKCWAATENVLFGFLSKAGRRCYSLHKWFSEPANSEWFGHFSTGTEKLQDSAGSYIVFGVECEPGQSFGSSFGALLLLQPWNRSAGEQCEKNQYFRHTETVLHVVI